MNIIDPHLHLFDFNKGNYPWLRSENPPFWPDKQLIAKNFSEHELMLTSPLTLAGFVHIEAGFDNQQPWREIAWLENICNLPFRSIALLDITLPKTIFDQQLKNLSRFQSLVGIRYILDDNAFAILNDKNSQDNLATLATNKLSFELQMPLANTQAVERLLAILAITPSLMLCINHAGWPALGGEQHLYWLKNLKRLANFENVFIKCSGFEMVARDYSASWQYVIIKQCIESFGIDRVMLASNFPLCLFRASYQNTWLANTGQHSTERDNTDPSYNTEQLQQLCFSNAQRFYKFD